MRNISEQYYTVNLLTVQTEMCETKLDARQSLTAAHQAIHLSAC